MRTPEQCLDIAFELRDLLNACNYHEASKMLTNFQTEAQREGRVAGLREAGDLINEHMPSPPSLVEGSDGLVFWTQGVGDSANAIFAKAAALEKEGGK